VSIRFEWGYGVLDSWYVSRDCAERLKQMSRSLTGMVIKPQEFVEESR
jgi:hypothetical protein